MNATKSMRLVRDETETRQQRALRQIEAEHRLNKWNPIDASKTRNPLKTDEILKKSYRPTDAEV